MPAKTGKPTDSAKMDRVVAEARRNRDLREHGNREQVLKLYPWICGCCAREFNAATMHLLCLYCHDNEHSRYMEAGRGGDTSVGSQGNLTLKPFANLKALLKDE